MTNCNKEIILLFAQMDLELFRALEVVLRAYSRQAPKNLIDHYLRLRIIVRILPPTFAQLAQHIRLSPT